MKPKNDPILHTILIGILLITMLPVLFVINNSFRTNTEYYHSFFGLPQRMGDVLRFTWYQVSGQPERIILRPDADGDDVSEGSVAVPVGEVVPYGTAMLTQFKRLTSGYRYCARRWST